MCSGSHSRCARQACIQWQSAAPTTASRTEAHVYTTEMRVCIIMEAQKTCRQTTSVKGKCFVKSRTEVCERRVMVHRCSKSSQFACYGSRAKWSGWTAHLTSLCHSFHWLNCTPHISLPQLPLCGNTMDHTHVHRSCVKSSGTYSSKSWVITVSISFIISAALGTNLPLSCVTCTRRVPWFYQHEMSVRIAGEKRE
jgi:hypothetical protein